MGIREWDRKKMRQAGGAAAVLFLFGLAVWTVARWTAPEPRAAAVKQTYSCPMHPEIVSEHPGQCPVCHMDLQKVDTASPAEPNASKARRILFYRHPMRGEITSKVPSKDEMGMDYVPVYEDEGSGVQGRAGFSLPPDRQQIIGVTTGRVEVQDLTGEVRASGRVAYDPDLYTAIEEYRQALLSGAQMKGPEDDPLRRDADALVVSARTKLRLLGLADSQIRRIGAGNASAMALLLPKGKAWIYAEVYEYELSRLREGQAVEVQSPSQLGLMLRGKVESISPVVNAQTRTARVRALVPDPQGQLRPDAFVNVRIKTDLGRKLAVPADAVLHSGEEAFVFVVEGADRFVPRKVALGPKGGNSYEVLEGLNTGDVVVTSANFLIDSESRLRGVLETMKNKDGEKKGKPQAPTGHESHGRGR